MTEISITAISECQITNIKCQLNAKAQISNYFLFPFWHLDFGFDLTFVI